MHTPPFSQVLFRDGRIVFKIWRFCYLRKIYYGSFGTIAIDYQSSNFGCRSLNCRSLNCQSTHSFQISAVQTSRYCYVPMIEHADVWTLPCNLLKHQKLRQPIYEQALPMIAYDYTLPIFLGFFPNPIIFFKYTSSHKDFELPGKIFFINFPFPDKRSYFCIQVFDTTTQ